MDWSTLLAMCRDLPLQRKISGNRRWAAMEYVEVMRSISDRLMGWFLVLPAVFEVTPSRGSVIRPPTLVSSFPENPAINLNFCIS